MVALVGSWPAFLWMLIYPDTDWAFFSSSSSSFWKPPTQQQLTGKSIILPLFPPPADRLTCHLTLLPATLVMMVWGERLSAFTQDAQTCKKAKVHSWFESNNKNWCYQCKERNHSWNTHHRLKSGGSHWWPGRGRTRRAAGRLARGAVGVRQHSLGWGAARRSIKQAEQTCSWPHCWFAIACKDTALCKEPLSGFQFSWIHKNDQYMQVQTHPNSSFPFTAPLTGNFLSWIQLRLGKQY